MLPGRFAESQGILMTENEVAKIIVDVAYKIHVQYGPSLLESA